MTIPNILVNGTVIDANPLNANFTFVNVPIGSIIAWAKTFQQRDSGTTTSTVANKLVEAGQNFLTTVSIGDVIFNSTDSTFAYISAVDSDTTLSITADIMPTGKAYSIYATPSLESNWVECNGQTLSDASSRYNGATIPPLNTSLGSGLKGYFLRGNNTSGGTETSQNLSHTHSYTSWATGSWATSGSKIAAAPSGFTTGPDGGTEARPSNYAIVWIMKVK